jgi:cobyric acid synthase
MKNKYDNLRDKLTSLIINLSHELNNNISLEDQEISSLDELAETLDEYLDLRSIESDGSSISVH